MIQIDPFFDAIKAQTTVGVMVLTAAFFLVGKAVGEIIKLFQKKG